MLKLVSDENFNADILRGLYRRRPDLDVVRVQDIGLSATPDPDILAWAAAEGRILLTHDRDAAAAYWRQRLDGFDQATPLEGDGGTPEAEGTASAGPTAVTPAAERRGQGRLVWGGNLERTLREAEDKRKLVFVDFTGLT